MNGLHEDVPVLIVKKKRTGHKGHHGGAWKVAYADFVTAMMALFIVLWIVGQSRQVKQYVANYFRDPGAFFENTKGGGLPRENDPTSPPEIVEELLRRQQEKLQQMGQEIFTQLKKEPKLAELSNQIKIEIVKEGMRIELLETSEKFFFDIGTANLKAEAEEVLYIIANEVAKLPNHLIIEGHTDSRRYSRVDGYTNFELSADRANAARRVLMRRDVSEQQVDEIRGYADNRLRNAANPLDASNRRISIIIKFDQSGHDGENAEDPHR
ncbi:MAG: OmpA family protein [Ignavibacteria bacterium]|nr:OmpA family protein [Ignavibacteria bacterium]